MKKYLFFAIAILAIILSSCYTTSYYYQIYDVKSYGEGMTSNLIYEDNYVKITYNFWKDGGDGDFLIENTSSQDIYVDLSKCFFIYNDYAFDYYKNTYKSTNYSSIAYYSNEGGRSVYHPAVSYTKYEIEDKVLCIPSHSIKKIDCPYSIHNTLYRDCILSLFPSQSRVWNRLTRSYESPALPSSEFSLGTSPIIFRNVISYYIENPEQSHRIENEFYVNKITNYPESSIMETHTKDKTMCGKEYNRYYSTNKMENASRFYYKYSNYTYGYSIDGH